jgi:hypothetical protein
LDVFLYYLKSSDDTNYKLKELSLSILRHLYYSGRCPQTKDRLDKLRVLEVTQYVTQALEGVGAQQKGLNVQTKKPLLSK